MHIKRYQAATMEEVLGQVRQELGPDALVLSTRSIRRSGTIFGWLSRPVVEVVAAVDRERRSPSSGPSGAVRDADPSWRSLSITQSLLDPIEAEIRTLRRSVDAIAAARDEERWQEQLTELRRVVTSLAVREAPSGNTTSGNTMMDRLLTAGWSPRHARDLAQAAGSRADAGDTEAVLIDTLAARLDARLPPPRNDDPHSVTLVVGSCGVGKTTTIAKLAARQPGAPEDSAILSTDVHRAGGLEPLRALSAERRIPFATAVSPEEAACQLGKLRARRILIDTCGQARHDPAGLMELARLRSACGNRARVHLVLDATTKEEDLRAELRRFAPTRPDTLILTHADETESLTSIANLLLDDATPPLSWLGVGRRVPEDLTLPEPRVLARQMLGIAA